MLQTCVEIFQKFGFGTGQVTRNKEERKERKGMHSFKLNFPLALSHCQIRAVPSTPYHLLPLPHHYCHHISLKVSSFNFQ
jgi:hypothetical protein